MISGFSEPQPDPDREPIKDDDDIFKSEDEEVIFVQVHKPIQCISDTEQAGLQPMYVAPCAAPRI